MSGVWGITEGIVEQAALDDFPRPRVHTNRALTTA